MGKTWITSAHRGAVTEKMHENTLSAFLLAAEKGADMIETDARMTADGILVANHDPAACGVDRAGNPLTLTVSESRWSDLKELILAPEDPAGPQGVPRLEEILHLAYFTGLQVNIDLKEGLLHAEEVAELVCASGLRGRVVYATNGAGAEAIHRILAMDPEGRFIDKPCHYTAEKLSSVPQYRKRCFAYTADFSEENIRRIRKSGCMLAAISLTEETAPAAFALHPEMAEYPHTSDFVRIEAELPFFSHSSGTRFYKA